MALAASRRGALVALGAVVALQGLGAWRALDGFFAGASVTDHLVSWAAWVPGGRPSVAALAVALAGVGAALFVRFAPGATSPAK